MLILLIILLNLSLLNSIDLIDTATLKNLYLFDKIINILQVFKEIDLDNKVSFVFDLFIETAINLHVLIGCEINFVGEIVYGIDDQNSIWVYFVNTG